MALPIPRMILTIGSYQGPSHLIRNCKSWRLSFQLMEREVRYEICKILMWRTPLYKAITYSLPIIVATKLKRMSIYRAPCSPISCYNTSFYFFFENVLLCMFLTTSLAMYRSYLSVRPTKKSGHIRPAYLNTCIYKAWHMSSRLNATPTVHCTVHIPWILQVDL